MACLSVEQFELIRRLRNSGIEREDLLTAFEQFDDIERTFGDIYAVPVSKIPINTSNVQNISNVQNTSNAQYNQPLSNRNVGTNKPRVKRGANEAVQPVYTPPPKRVNPVERVTPVEENGNVIPSNNLKSKPTTQSQSSSNQVTSVPPAVPDVFFPHLSRNGLTISAVSAPSGVSSQNHASPNEDANWGPAINKMKKCEDIKSEGEMLAEIRQFLIKHSLKLSTISEMTNLSASHVRSYVHGNLNILPDEVKQKIYSWYEVNKNNPPVVSAQSDSDSHFKRERFTFRAIHIRILEENFKMDSFPDNHKREFIADECNRAYAEEMGVSTVHPRDRLNSSLITNWFINRRKETRRPVKRGSHSISAAMENNQLIKMADVFDGMTSPTSMEPQDIKPNISEMMQTSSISTPPSYSPAEDNDSFMVQKNEPFIPIQNIKQEPPDN